jgi:hypothetical protein
MKESWLIHLRRCLSALNRSIWVENAWTPKLQQVGDVSLMEALSQLDSAKKADLITANNCRMYLRIITLFDITTMNGRAIDKRLIDGSTRAESTLRWPMQPLPTDRMWTTFRRLLKRVFCTKRGFNQRDKMILDTPLRDWLQEERHVKNTIYRTSRKMYLRETVDDLEAWKRRSNRTMDTGIIWQYSEHPTGNYFLREKTVMIIPPQAQPVTAYFKRNAFMPTMPIWYNDHT